MEQLILNLVKNADPDNPLQYVQNIVKDYAKEKLDEQILACQDCKICDSCRSLAHGNTNASILIIGSHAQSLVPLTNESYNLAFYDNESSYIIDKTLEIIKANKNEIMFANVLGCMPYKELGGEKVPRIPNSKELEQCKVFINHLIDIVQPLVIITMGAVALNAFKKNCSIINEHGQWFDIKGIPAIATYSPEYFIQIKGKKDEELILQQQYDFIDDVTKGFQYIKENYPKINIMMED